MRKGTLIALGLVLLGACECEQPPLSQLVPLLAPEVARTRLPDLYVGASAEAAVRFQSNGTGVVTIHGVTLEDATAAGFSLVNTGARADALNPGASFEVRVAFAPVAEGPASVVVVVESDAENGPTRTVIEANALAPLPCGPTTACQRRFFDPATGTCVSENLAGPCDDENACTEDDACLDGACVGTAATCASPVDCARGVCDASEGCLLIPEHDRCDDDGNPCTVERCDVEQGCVRELAPDGMSCGPAPSCAAAAVCQSGACIEVPAPDGTPCEDRDYCTVDEACIAGTCVGTRVGARAAGPVSEVRTFGLMGGGAALLSGRRVLFADPLHAEEDIGFRVTVVELDDDGMQVLTQTDFPGEPPLGLRFVEPSPGVLINFHREAGHVWARRLEIAADGTVAIGPVTETPGMGMSALPDGRIVLAVDPEPIGGTLALLDPADLSVAPLTQLPNEEGLAVTVGSAVPFAAGIAVGTSLQLYHVGLDGSAVPFGTPPERPERWIGLASDAGRLAALTCPVPAAMDPCEVVLFDASHQEVGRVTTGTTTQAQEVALDGDFLILGNNGGTVAYDVSAPSAPVPLAETLPWKAGLSEYFTFRDGLGVISNVISLPGRPSPVVVALSNTGLRFVTHPRWGSPGTPRAHGDRILAAAAWGVHHLEVGEDGAPLLVAGRPLGEFVEDPGARRSLILSNGAALLGRPPRYGGHLARVYQMPLATTEAGPLLPLRTIELPRGRFASNRRYAAALDLGMLHLFDLLWLPPEDEMSFAPLSTTPLPWSDWARSPVVAIDGGNQIAALGSTFYQYLPRAELLLLDASAPEAPVLVGRAELHIEPPEDIYAPRDYHLAIAGASVVVLAEVDQAVRVLRRMGDGTVVEAMRFETDAARILHFDGHNLVLTGPASDSLSFWDVSGAAPIDLGTVALPDEAFDAEPLRESLVVSGQGSYLVLEPPCPPLP